MKRALLAALAVLLAAGCGKPSHAVQDTAAPTITALSPADATTVGSRARIQITFSEPMNTGAVAVQVDDGVSTYDLGTPAWSAGDTVVTFTPPAPLDFGADCTLSVSGEDLSHNALAGTRVTSFAVGPQPTVLAISPANGVAGVAIAARPSITFNTAMDRPSVEASLAVHQGTSLEPVSCSFAWTSDSTQVTCLPAADFKLGWPAGVDMGAGAKGSLGDGLASAATSAFTIEAAPEPPRVLTVTPAAGATAAARTATIVVTFSKPMSLASAQAAFSLSVNGVPTTFPTPTWDAAESVMTVTPAAFAYGAAVTWTVSTAATDKGGLAMTAPTSGGFHVVKLGAVSIPVTSLQSGYLFKQGSGTPTITSGSALRAGDSASNGAYRGFATFPLAASFAAPPSTILTATLSATGGSAVGVPFKGTLGDLLVQSVFIDTLDAADWDVATDFVRGPCKLQLPSLDPPPGVAADEPPGAIIVPVTCPIQWAVTAAAFSLDVTGKVRLDAANTARKGLSQFRLRFATDTDANGVADYVGATLSLAVGYEYGW